MVVDRIGRERETGHDELEDERDAVKADGFGVDGGEAGGEEASGGGGW